MIATRHGYVTLDCRDGVHRACAICDCLCHVEEDTDDHDYAEAVDAQGPPAEHLTETDLSPLDLDPRESLDERITA